MNIYLDLDNCIDRVDFCCKDMSEFLIDVDNIHNLKICNFCGSEINIINTKKISNHSLIDWEVVLRK